MPLNLDLVYLANFLIKENDILICMHCLKQRFRNKLQDEVQVDLPFLLARQVEVIQELDDVAVVQPPHYVELAVLEALVTQHPLDGHSLSCVGYLPLG